MRKPAERVLIYRLGSLGDTLVALPALNLVARAFPSAERRMLTNLPVDARAPAAASVLEGTGLVHGYMRYAVGTRRPGELLRLWIELIRWRPQVLVYMAAARGIAVARRDARFFRFAGIFQQIGVPLTEEMQENRVEDGINLEPEAGRLVRNLATLGDGRLEDPKSWSLELSASEAARAREALTAADGWPVIAVCVGTKVQAKDWGQENWRELLASIARLYPEHACVLCGAAEEAETSEFVAAGWRGATATAGPVLNLCGKLTPRETAAVIRTCRLLIGHDSGPMHLAAAVETPCIAIFAARNKPRVWFPYGRHHRILYHRVECWGCGLETCIVEKKKCLTSITVAEVLAEVEAMLIRS